MENRKNQKEIVKALKASCPSFVEDVIPFQRIGYITKEGRQLQVAFQGEYHYWYLVLLWSHEIDESNPFSQEDMEDMNERFICGKCAIENHRVILSIGFPIIHLEWLGEQLTAALTTMNSMIAGTRISEII